MERKRYLVPGDEGIDRRPSGGHYSVVRNPSLLGSQLHGGVLGIQEHRQLGLVEVPRIGGGSRRGDRVGVVEHDPEIPQAADAGLRTDRRQSRLDAWKAQCALLGLAGSVVEIDLLIRASRNAEPPAPAPILVDEDDTVLGALVQGA